MNLHDKLEEIKELIIGNAYVDLGNGFKFIIDSIEINSFNSVIIRVHPKSIKWIELEHDLEKEKARKKDYDQFLAEYYEAEDEFWKEYFEDIEADRVISEQKENF